MLARPFAEQSEAIITDAANRMQYSFDITRMRAQWMALSSSAVALLCPKLRVLIDHCARPGATAVEGQTWAHNARRLYRFSDKILSFI